MAEVIKVMLCCFAPAILYQIAKTIREQTEERMMYIPDNFDAYDRHEKEEAEWLASRPVCAWCGEPIQEECAYRIGDEWVCEQCIDDRREYID